MNIEGNAEMARVIGLLPWMDYEFQVIASNILGSGEPSVPSYIIRTQQSGELQGARCAGEPQCTGPQSLTRALKDHVCYCSILAYF